MANNAAKNVTNLNFTELTEREFDKLKNKILRHNGSVCDRPISTERQDTRICIIYDDNGQYHMVIYSELSYYYYGPTKKVSLLKAPLKTYGKDAIDTMKYLCRRVQQMDAESVKYHHEDDGIQLPTTIRYSIRHTGIRACYSPANVV